MATVTQSGSRAIHITGPAHTTDLLYDPEEGSQAAKVSSSNMSYSAGGSAIGQVSLIPGGDAPGAGVACEGINNLNQMVCVVMDPNGNTVGDFIGTPDANQQ